MADLVLKAEELAQLDRLVGQIPTVYGAPIANLINYVLQLRQQEANVKVGDGKVPIGGLVGEIKAEAPVKALKTKGSK